MRTKMTIFPSKSISYSPNNLGIYVHVPFCRKKCAYCDFFSVDSFPERMKDEYSRKLLEQVSTSLEITEGMNVVSCYIGGGSPSLMHGEFFLNLSKVLRNHGVSVDEIEFSVEVNPFDVTPGFLTDLKESGINRVSLGIQSADDFFLEKMGRRYTKKDLEAVLPLVGDMFPHLSLDLIYGMGSEKGKLKRSLSSFFPSFLRNTSPHTAIPGRIEHHLPIFLPKRKCR